MIVLHTVASLHPDDGGPSRTVSATCRHLAEAGHRVEIVTQRRTAEAPSLAPVHDGVRTTYVTGATGLSGVRAYGRRLQSRLREVQPALLHDHGLWLPTNVASAWSAHKHDVPLVVTTRGMLEPWALKQNRWKKTAAWYAYQRRVLRSAALLHATAEMEARHLRDLGLDAPIAVIPNGVPVPKTWKQDPTDGSPRQALFLSRIHPKKGLLNLVDAWAEAHPDGWRLVIAGPDEDGHRREVARRVRTHGLDDVVTFPGTIADDAKWDLYRDSDLFVLPTFSENFGVVVAEALASGIPAITTTGAPWQILEAEDCGWWVEPRVDALAHALADATTRSDADRLAMGRRGRAVVTQQFSWHHVAAQLYDAYRWVLGDAPPPDCVVRD